jgi:hypothetical protein
VHQVSESTTSLSRVVRPRPVGAAHPHGPSRAILVVQRAAALPPVPGIVAASEALRGVHGDGFGCARRVHGERGVGHGAAEPGGRIGLRRRRRDLRG